MKSIALAAVLLLTALTAACGEEPPPGADPFGTDDWRLVAGTVDGTALVLVDGFPVTLRIDNGQLGGTAACNSYGGPITIVDGVVAIGPGLVQTEMYCLEETVMDLEGAFLAALPRVDAVTVVGELLVLIGDGVELRFEVVPPEPDAALIGTNWTLDTITEGEVASTPAAPATLVFSADGSVSGSTGCNSLFGSYSAADGFSPLGTTKMACEPAVMDQEALVLAILGPEATLTIAGSSLTIADLAGRTLVYRAGI
jgi:heat shock protein HslJ